MQKTSSLITKFVEKGKSLADIADPLQEEEPEKYDDDPEVIERYIQDYLRERGRASEIVCICKQYENQVYKVIQP